jgi:tetratricopeptide (TPR) repeat protein
MFYGVTIFPALGFANIYPMRYTFVADHYVYLASLGLFVPLAAVLWKLPRVWLASVSGVLVVTLMALTMSRSRVFLGPIPLWEDVIAKNEWSWMAHENLGHAYNARWQGDAKGSPEQAADEQKAQEQYLIADRLTPAWVSDVHWGLAGFYFRQNRFDEAQGELQEVLDLDPNNERVWSLLGDVQSAKGLFDEAARTYRKASDIDPGSSGPHTRLGTLYEMKLLDDSDAEHEYRTALALNPNDLLAHYNLGNILLKQKKFTDSIAQFQAVLALDSNHPEALYNEAVAYAYLHDNASAAACANDVLKLNPQFDPARELLRRLGMPETP